MNPSEFFQEHIEGLEKVILRHTGLTEGMVDECKEDMALYIRLQEQHRTGRSLNVLDEKLRQDLWELELELLEMVRSGSALSSAIIKKRGGIDRLRKVATALKQKTGKREYKHGKNV